MLRDFVNAILELAPGQVVQHEGRSYRTGQLDLMVDPENERPETQRFPSLFGFAEFALDNLSQFVSGTFCKVASFAHVELHSPLIPAAGNRRHCYATADPDPVDFEFARYYDLERFVTLLQTCFVGNRDSRTVAEFLSKMASTTIHQANDDGLVQEIEVKQSLTTKSLVRIENPLKLKPWRTFPEIEQPETIFVLRLDSGVNKKPAAALYYADGGRWKLDAMNTIRAELKQQFGNSIKVY